jgi:hypothetical protein
VSGGHILVSGGHILVSGGVILVSGGHILVSGGHILVSGGHILVSGGHILVSGGGSEPLTATCGDICVDEIPKGEGASIHANMDNGHSTFVPAPCPAGGRE